MISWPHWKSNDFPIKVKVPWAISTIPWLSELSIFVQMPRIASHHWSNSLTIPAALPAINLPSTTHWRGLSQKSITNIRKEKMFKHMERGRIYFHSPEAVLQICKPPPSWKSIWKFRTTFIWQTHELWLSYFVSIFLRLLKTLQEEYFLMSFTIFAFERFRITLGRFMKKIIIIWISGKLWSKWDHVYENYV